jgi:hypothetical protein
MFRPLFGHHEVKYLHIHTQTSLLIVMAETWNKRTLCGPYTINHVAQNSFAQRKFAHSRSSQSAPYTVNHVAQHAMLRNMIDRVWAPLSLP